ASGMGHAMMGDGSGHMGGEMSGHMGPGHMGSGHVGDDHGAGTATAPIEGTPTVTVTAGDLHFSPAEISLASQAVNLTLKNEGALVHDLTIPALGVHLVARPGETATMGLRDLPPGRYDGYCGVPGHADAGMRIIVVVE
ncbi:MAG TPA: cupredoxin domain-containing protein, partial [Candidatus Limnocylindrales bacterium]|nr:cupredoxin domain-containing protein [Candidatus Limnocylindrales bacterium]